VFDERMGLLKRQRLRGPPNLPGGGFAEQDDVAGDFVAGLGAGDRAAQDGFEVLDGARGQRAGLCGEPAVNVFGGEFDEFACAERGDDVAVGEDAASLDRNAVASPQPVVEPILNSVSNGEPSSELV
jgi:hypothetical protein